MATDEGLRVVSIAVHSDSVVVEWDADDLRIPWPGDPDDGPAEPKSERLTLTDDKGTAYYRTAGSAYFRPTAHGTVTFEPAPPAETTTLVARGEHRVATLDLKSGRLTRASASL
ncbi:MAG TPA: hypothetical protein VN238_01160 [Solirubrobacteraceae bacterium]|nr:hypothetical protein [Solirubrobacteraceae bacterium]